MLMYLITMTIQMHPFLAKHLSKLGDAGLRNVVGKMAQEAVVAFPLQYSGVG